MLFSRFAHKTVNGETVAYFNSLRLRPVFLPVETARDVETLFPRAQAEQATSSSTAADKCKDAIEALRQAKVLIESADYDDKVLEYVLSTLHPPYVQIAYFILSDLCNFGCKYCFIRNDMASDYRQQNMTMEVATKGIEMFARLVARDAARFNEDKSIIFYGGEPLLNGPVLRSLILQIQEYKKTNRLPQKLQVSLVTNGSLITPEIADFLKQHDVGVGISIDGDAAATNSCRCYADGRPVFPDVLKAITTCQKAGVNLSLSVTLTEQSVVDFDRTLKTLLDIAPNSIGFNMIVTDKHFSVPDWYNEKVSACMVRAFEEFRQRGIPEDRIMRKATAFSESRVYPFDCGATGGNQIVVAPDGRVGICHGYLAERKYFVTSVDDTAFDPQSDPVYQEWAKRTPLRMPECQTCPALGICGGGCPMHAEKNTGSLWGIDSRFCVHAKATLEWLIWDVFKTINNSTDGSEEPTW